LTFIVHGDGRKNDDPGRAIAIRTFLRLAEVLRFLVDDVGFPALLTGVQVISDNAAAERATGTFLFAANIEHFLQ